MSELKETIDNGESEVQIATVGTIIGSDLNGNPIEQNFSEQALQSIATNLNHMNEEKLVDRDHKSMKKFEERDTTSMGWISGFFVKPGKGLFGKIKWSDIGRKLVENRCFRWLSPVFKISTVTNEPVELVNVALTNLPSQYGQIDPIVNSAPTEISIAKEDILNMTKEELVDLIKDTITAMNAAPCQDEKKDEEVKCEQPEAEELKAEEAPVEDKTETEVENTCDKEVKNEEEKPMDEEPSEESKPDAEPETASAEEPELESKEEEEVIKIEALNSTPTIGASLTGKEAWKDLHGKAFFDWIAANGCGKYK